MPTFPTLSSAWRHRRSAVWSGLIGLFVLGLVVWILGMDWADRMFSGQPLFSHLVPLGGLLVAIGLCHARFVKVCARIRNNEKSLEFPPFTFLHGARVIAPVVLLGLLGLSVVCYLGGPFWFRVDFFQIALPHLKVTILLLWVVAAWNGWLVGDKKPAGKGAKPPIDDLADYPITQEKQDLLGRKPLVDMLVTEIQNRTSAESFVYGVQGGAGEGKTSLLNLAANRLKQSPSVLPVFFNPWFLHGETALVKNFFSTLDETINQEFYLPRFHRLISKYGRIVRFGTVSDGSRPVPFLPGDDLFSLRKEIEKILGTLGKKVVVIVDEIDRLPPGEIPALFSIVKQSAKFRHTVYLLGYDPEVVRKKLEGRGEPGSEILYKVVQKPVTLLAPPGPKALEFLLLKLDLRFQGLGISPEKRDHFREQFTEFWYATLRDLLGTLRSVKRLLNGFGTSIAPVHREVDLFDFVLVEILRTFFHAVYADVRDRYWFYISSTTVEDGWTDLSVFGMDEDEKSAKIRSHVEGLLDAEANPFVLKGILSKLFPWMDFSAVPGSRSLPTLDDADRAAMRVCHPGSFFRYFSLAVDEKPPDSEVERLVKRANTLKADVAIQEILATLSDAKVAGYLEGLLQKVEMFEPLLTDEGRKVLSWGIAHNTRQYDKKSASSWKPTEYEQALKLVLHLVTSVERNEMRSLLISDLIQNSPDGYFVIRLVGGLVKSTDGIDVEEIRNLASGRLRRRYFMEKHNLFEDFASDELRNEVIWAWGTNFGLEDETNRGDLNLYILAQLKSDPRLTVPFLRLFRVGGKFHFDQFERLFKAEKIYQIVLEHRFDLSGTREGAALVEEFLEAYDSRQIQGGFAPEKGDDLRF